MHFGRLRLSEAVYVEFEVEGSYKEEVREMLEKVFRYVVVENLNLNLRGSNTECSLGFKLQDEGIGEKNRRGGVAGFRVRGGGGRGAWQ